ncbi:hypothetical protein ACQP1U_09970 [Actinomycetota bacterium]
MDADEVDGATMLRTWGEVVESAGDLWDSLPRPDIGAEDTDYSLMAQLQAMNGHLMRTARGRQWPGEGDPDERLLRIAENLTRASDLLARRDSTAMNPQIRADVGAARARLVHTLYIGVHVTLDREVMNMQARRAAVRSPEPGKRPPGPDYPNNLEFAVLSRTRDRIAAFEQLAGSYVSRTYPHALDGEHKPPPQADRLRQALVTWDIQAHRSLSRSPSAENIFLAAQTQMMIAQGGQVLLRAAGQAGRIEADLYASRLGPAMDNAHAAWSNLSRSWSHLMPPHALVNADRSLVEAANEVRAAYRDVAYDRTRPADAFEIADRVELRATAQTVQQSISSSVDVAHVIGHATDDTDVRVPARLLNARAQHLQGVEGAAADAPSGGWVTAAEHVNNAPAVLPELVREELQARTDAVAASTSVAMGAASSLESRASSPARPAANGRMHQDRAVAQTSVVQSIGLEAGH